MVYTQPSICPGEWHTQSLMGLWHWNGSPNLGQKTRPYSNQQIKKENLQNWWLCCTGWPQNKTERKGVKKKLWNMKMTIIPIVIGAFVTVTKGLLKGLGDLEIGGRVDSPNYIIVENSQNTEKSPGDLRRLAVTQTQMKDHQLSLMWKTLKE